MDPQTLEDLLLRYKAGELTSADIISKLAHFPICKLEHAQLDFQREVRSGFPEVVYGEGKSHSEISEIVEAFLDKYGKVLVTRLLPEQLTELQKAFPALEYFPRGRIARSPVPPSVPRLGRVALLTAGTSDRAVAEETRVCAEYLALNVAEFHDVGIAGLHRLIEALEEVKSCDIVIVVAGMEGALPGIVAGLVPNPVIALPTSVGYGAAFGGATAFLSMLVSCSPGLTVVNIDNGFGAAFAAARIIRHLKQERRVS